MRRLKNTAEATKPDLTRYEMLVWRAWLRRDLVPGDKLKSKRLQEGRDVNRSDKGSLIAGAKTRALQVRTVQYQYTGGLGLTSLNPI